MRVLGREHVLDGLVDEILDVGWQVALGLCRKRGIIQLSHVQPFSPLRYFAHEAIKELRATSALPWLPSRKGTNELALLLARR